MYIQEWQAQMDSYSDNRFYKYIKLEFEYEKYPNYISYKSFRMALTKIRMGSHRFIPERGRWAKPKFEYKDRLCPVCNDDEEEYHCFVPCPRFTILSKKYLSNCIMSNPSMFKFIKLFQEGSIFQQKSSYFLLLMFNKLKECDIYQFIYSFTFKSFIEESTKTRMYKLSTYLHQKIS